MKNGQIHFKILALLRLQDFKSMLGHFSTLCMKMVRISKCIVTRFQFIIKDLVNVALINSNSEPSGEDRFH